MESIFHEKQEGYLCAQHCLNALLQGSYFNAVDLANLAHQMDEEERIRMAESGLESEDYQRFLQQPSGNMDDSGYFSVQVISSALKVWGLELIPYNGTEPIALAAQNDPAQMRAYICNYKGHWFTIRKIGNQWFNLNSVLGGPQLLSDTYLAMYLAQLLQEGYSIFVVIGEFPECVAEDVILRNPVSASTTRTRKNSQSTISERRRRESFTGGYRLGTAEEEDRAKILEAAHALEQVKVPAEVRRDFGIASSSRFKDFGNDEKGGGGGGGGPVEDPRERIIPIRLESNREKVEQVVDEDEEDEEEEEKEEEANLKRALQLSLCELEETNNIHAAESRFTSERKNWFDTRAIPNSGVPDESEDDEEMKKALRLSLECVTTPATPETDEDLRKALQLSLECAVTTSSSSTTPDPDDLRRRRLVHLGILSRTTTNESCSTKLNT